MNSRSATSASPLRGIIIGPLGELRPDRIVVADRTLFLRNGESCGYSVGVVLEVVYTELNGRASVERIALAGRAE